MSEQERLSGEVAHVDEGGAYAFVRLAKGGPDAFLSARDWPAGVPLVTGTKITFLTRIGKGPKAVACGIEVTESKAGVVVPLNKPPRGYTP